jgi:hypothetical protein
MAEEKTEGKPAERKATWHWWVIEKLGFPVLVAILASVITFLWMQYNGRVRSLSYTVTTASGLFQRPQLPGKEIKLLVDGRPVENISTISLALFNLTDQDYDNVPLVVTFVNEDGTQPRPIFASAISWPDGLVQSPQTQPTSAPATSLRYQYTLDVVNRGDKSVWMGTYTFEGNKAPTLRLGILKKGLTAKVVEVGGKETPTSLIPPWETVLICIGAVAFYHFIQRMFRAVDRKLAQVIAENRKARAESVTRLAEQAMAKAVTAGDRTQEDEENGYPP